MSQVDPVTADWLRSDGLRVVQANAAVAAWGDRAVESVIRTPFDQPADAVAEAARQIQVLGKSRAVELLRVAGQHVELIGKPVTLVADAEGYRGGAVVFVIGAEELPGDDATRLRIVRRLA